MKKIIVNEYGSVDVLQEVVALKPVPGEKDVLIKVAAIGVNDPDIVMRKYGPFPTMPAEFRPTLPHMLGGDFSGIVEQVGAEVTKFQVGDHVMGYTKRGTYAQYIVLDQDDSLSQVPDQLDLIPLGGLYLTALIAWSAIMKNGHLQAGQKVLIHGGAGGVGSMAIQIAKAAGATVITTARS
ncbi:NADP-dependent oxidoreductase [Lactiplantibacillus plantarum]|uniref:quinone oxidoreductase family protein n=1 Tax=Lactiplantibacillus plantarum TaxID=1590 RepID=UPI0030AB3322